MVVQFVEVYVLSVGGLVGFNYNGIIQNAYATGAVQGVNRLVGGLVGMKWKSIQNAYATGASEWELFCWWFWLGFQAFGGGTIQQQLLE